MMTHWPSPAKLNLFLYITGQRADGYHTLQTLFQFLDYGDTLHIEPRHDGEIHLLTPVNGVENEDNLTAVWVAAHLTPRPFWWRSIIFGNAGFPLMNWRRSA